MNLTELAEALPNGLHDAELSRWTVDYTARTAVLEVDVWVATAESPREWYRPARITLRELEYFVVDPPDSRYPFRNAETVTIDLAAEENGFAPRALTAPAFRFFVSEWNAFIHAAAAGAEIEWLAPATPRGG